MLDFPVPVSPNPLRHGVVAPDHIAEIAMIEMSRLQRSVLERWVPILVDAGEFDLAAQVSAEARQATEGAV
jgi:hypothetical protein